MTNAILSQETQLQHILNSCLKFELNFKQETKIKKLLPLLFTNNITLRQDLSRKVLLNIVNPIDKHFEKYLLLESNAYFTKNNKEFEKHYKKQMLMLLAISKFARLMIGKIDNTNIYIAIAELEQDIFDINKNFTIECKKK